MGAEQSTVIDAFRLPRRGGRRAGDGSATRGEEKRSLQEPEAGEGRLASRDDGLGAGEDAGAVLRWAAEEGFGGLEGEAFFLLAFPEAEREERTAPKARWRRAA